MPGLDYALVPVVQHGVLAARPGIALRVTMADGSAAATLSVGQTGRHAIEPLPTSDMLIEASQGGNPVPGSPLHVQLGGWSGNVDWSRGGLAAGWARNLRHPNRDCVVVAFSGSTVLAVASARAAENGQFLMRLPPEVTGAQLPMQVKLGIAGSDYTLDGGVLNFGGLARHSAPDLVRQPVAELGIRIKISTPNLKEAPMWGDFHFANSLAAAFERIGHQAGVDTADAWYAQTAQEDVVIAIRGRHRVKIDKGKVNLMWVISHPDRIPDDEYADYDHVFVASDIYAAELQARGLPSVSVLHQATDATLFRADATFDRRASCLFVGNSRKEYRTMVKWCVQKDIPLDLYGGGWEGILPDEAVRGTSVANQDLPAFYGGHLMLLNDHWDSMRENGFLSNRLFDGSGVGTPILTDPVAGLADVFGDTISEAGDIERFAEIVKDCLENPTPYLERAARARQIVHGAHTFDHRAAEIAQMIDRINFRKF